MNLPITHLFPAEPAVRPPLDPEFAPASLINRRFRDLARLEGSVSLRIAVERADGVVSTFDTEVFRSSSPYAPANLSYVERIVKFLLWQRGGWRVVIGGPLEIGEGI